MKKVLTAIVVVVLMISIVCCVGCTKETSFDKVVKCAKDLQDSMTELADFESFEIDGDCGYRRGYDDYPFTVFIYVPFKVTFTDGEYWEDVAYYVGGSFLGFYTDFDDGTYEEDLELEDQLLYLNTGLIYLGDEAQEKFSKEEVTQAIS